MARGNAGSSTVLYKQADKYGIELPFEVPKENFTGTERIDNGVNGTVEYPKEFNKKYCTTTHGITNRYQN